jgi:hypothetical protein
VSTADRIRRKDRFYDAEHKVNSSGESCRQLPRYASVTTFVFLRRETCRRTGCRDLASRTHESLTALLLCRGCAAERFDVIVEPDWAEGFDHLGAAVGEAFEFDVGVVDVVLDQGGVEVSDRW